MKRLTLINRETGKTENIWEGKNVKSYCKPEDIQKMREKDDHEMFYFMVCFKGLGYDLGMWEVDKFDLVID